MQDIAEVASKLRSASRHEMASHRREDAPLTNLAGDSPTASQLIAFLNGDSSVPGPDDSTPFLDPRE